jgi:hypothetical protein
MKIFTALSFALTASTYVIAWPHHKDPTPTEIDWDMLEKPMHTTALMAGEAWKLTERLRSMSQTTLPTALPTAAGEQLEL